MKNEVLNIKGVCFGEILWDNLPTGRKLGGAPLNVAYHLNKLGIYTDVLTRVGSDANGQEIVSLCRELSIPLTLFQEDHILPTSTVEVHIDDNKDVRYEIVYPVAWDDITLGELELQTVREADFFVFGSLSTRNDVSYQTLKGLVKQAKYKILDVNLRAPFYTKERIFELIGYADLVKMNEEELGFVSAWLGLPPDMNDQSKSEAVMNHFAVPELIVTYGAAGAIYHSTAGHFSHHYPALKVEVKDTIGSGDSFLAAFLSLRCRNDKNIPAEEILEFAATLSGYVTQSSGACPNYDATAINRFVWLNELQ